MDAVVDTELLPKQVAFGIKSAYPFQRFVNRFEEEGVIPVWYPWYYISLIVRMDTYLKKGMSYNDFVAVDGLRPIRERVGAMPQESGEMAEGSDALRLEPKISEKEAEAEAADLLKGIVLSRNKLLKDHEIEVRESKLFYLKTFVVKIRERPPADWLFIDSHFDAAARLKMRPEIFKPIENRILYED